MSWASGVTYEAEGLSLPDVCPTLLVTTATPAEAKEGRWFGINRLVKEKKRVMLPLVSTSEQTGCEHCQENL